MRIGYVLKKFPRLSETFILNELLGLEALGHEVTIFSLREPDDEPRHKSLEDLRAQVHVIPRRGIEDALQPDIPANRYLSFLPPERRRRIWAQATHIASLCCELKIEHLHAHFMTVASHTAAVAGFLGSPSFSVTAHAKDIFRHGLSEDLFRETAAQAGCVVTVSHYNKGFIEDRFYGGEVQSLPVVYNGLPIEEIAGPRAAIQKGRQILAVGRLVAKKGFDLLLKACAQLRDRHIPFNLEIVGGGEERRSLEEEVQELGLSDVVRFVGPLPREKVIERMREARCLALPCVEGPDGNRDALPTVLIEAIATGLPVVASRFVGIPEIVTHERCGLLVDAGNVEELSQALQRLLDDDELCQKLSDQATEIATRRFDRNNTLPSLVQVFENCRASAQEESG